MECFICHQVFKPGEHVFFGSQMVCGGLGYMDFDCLPISDDSMCAMHLACLENPTEIVVEPNSAIYKPIKEELAVQRSDALAIFDL